MLTTQKNIVAVTAKRDMINIVCILLWLFTGGLSISGDEGLEVPRGDLPRCLLPPKGDLLDLLIIPSCILLSISSSPIFLMEEFFPNLMVVSAFSPHVLDDAVLNEECASSSSSVSNSFPGIYAGFFFFSKVIAFAMIPRSSPVE
jgi:hypothetical protein